MKKKFKKALIFCYSKSKDCIEIIFQSPATNQIRFQKERNKRFDSYIQLKRYQKHLRKISLRIFLAAVFIFIGILFGPVVYKDQFESEIYIPDGKGDILIGNISKNQANIIFKTLDAKNENRPLATSAVVEIYLDPELKILLKKTDISEYAVTHIIPVSGLQEGKSYYIKVMASELKNMENSKNISRWGGNEPISFYTSGDVISACPVPQNFEREVDEEDEFDDNSNPVFAQPLEQIEKNLKNDEDIFRISGVQNENYLHGKDKIQTIISWNTNEISDSTLIYRTIDEENEIEVKTGNEDNTKHAVVLTSLKPETVYYFKVKSKNKKGEIAVSNEYSMKTPHPRETILEIVGGNLKALIRQIGI